MSEFVDDPTANDFHPNRPMCAVRGCLRQDALYRINPTGPGRDFEGMCPEHYQELVEASRGGEE